VTDSSRTAVRTVVVADARPVIAQGLAAALTGHPLLEAAGVSTDTELIAAIESRAPRVIVVPLDRGGGVPELLECALRAAAECTDVVVVGSPGSTAGSLSGPLIRGLRAVLPASSTAQELAEAIAALGPSPDGIRVPQTRTLVAGGQGDDGVPAREDVLTRLTAREHEVLGLLAQGRSTREIADALSVSVNTVRAHVNVLLHKLGVHSRLRAVALFTDGAAPARSPEAGPADG
jgi:two-component system nitrate/nitrite response regulator NarL